MPKNPASRINRTATRQPVNYRLSTIAATAFDATAVAETVQRFLGRNLRVLPDRDLNAAVAELTRAGVNPAMARAQLGKTLLAQLLHELARRAARDTDSPPVTARPVVLGAYSSALADVVDGPAPRKYSQYR